jgi:hypothetical protein
VGELNGRFLDLTVDTIKITGVRSPGLRVTARVTRSLKPTANSAEIEIYNLNPEHRAALTKIAHPAVALVAGYSEDKTAIFYGQALHVSHERKSTDGDVITKISTTDSGGQLQTARVHATFKAGVKAGDVLRGIVKALGVKPGNLETAVSKLNAGKLADVYFHGAVLNGHAPSELDAICRSAGLEWSVQSGGLQFLDIGSAVAGQAIVLTEDKLTATPSLSEKNVVECQTFVQRDFLPGHQVQIKSEFVTGAYRLESCRFSIDTYEDEWYVDFSAKGPPPK